MSTAFVTGITGQDGQHLAEFLHSQGYHVFGMVKGQNNPRVERLQAELPFVELVPGDLADLPSLVGCVADGAARRGVQPGRDLVRGVEFFAGGVDGEHHRVGCVAHVGSGPDGGWGDEQPDPLLSGVIQ